MFDGLERNDEVETLEILELHGVRRAELDPTTVWDVYATILHLLGFDHTRLTYYHNGLNQRLTNVHGLLLEDILA